MPAPPAARVGSSSRSASESPPRSGVASVDPEAPSVPASGRSVGPYILHRQLGSGAMGEVWLARHASTGSRAAVKVLHAHVASHGRFQEFFARERRAIARLSHPHVLRLHDVGPGYLVTAYVEGSDPARRLNTPCDPATAARWTLQIASALEHAHGRGVIHRDVKPSNILIDLRGNAYLADFGLAVILDEVSHGTEECRAGTPTFMAPEQALGGAVGPAADQYALGRTLIEMLCGGTVPTEARAALDMLPASLPGAMRDVLTRATMHRPSDRWPSMAAFADALAAVNLEACSAPVRLAPELRVRSPFAWCIQASHVDAPTPEITRADYRLDELERAGLLAPQRCAEFRAATGYEQIGWSLFGHTGRLGPLTHMSAMARASDLVLLLHGMFCSRREWEEVALAICRDNAQAVVLVPDLLGCGESRFGEGAPAAEQVSPRGMALAAVAVLDLLSLRDLPCVLVGHSIAGTALLSVTDAELGERVSRIAITPVYPVDSGFGRSSVRVWASIFGAATRVETLKRLYARSMTSRADLRMMPGEMRARMVGEFLRASPATLRLLFGQLADARPAPRDGMNRCLVLVGDDDPIAPPSRIGSTFAQNGLPSAMVEHLIGNGHYPHAENEQRPERSGRNVSDLARHVETMLTTAREGAPLSTIVASTLLEPTSAAADRSTLRSPARAAGLATDDGSPARTTQTR